METSSNTRHHTVNPITGDDNKFKDSGVPQTTSSHSYSSENVILRKDIPRPCAVIGPGVIPPYHRVDGYMPHIWPQSSDGSPTYYRHPQVQFCSDRVYPPRNISPRHTFQENMSRIIVPSPSEVKFRNYSGNSQSGSTVPETAKPNILPDTKFCDESVLVNPRSVDLIRSQYNRSNDVPLRHEVQGAAVPQYAVHGYPVNKIHNASASPYSNVYNCPPEFQRYPLEYQNPGIQLVKNNQIYQKLPEQSSFIVANEYPASKYSRMNNIRYEPYPPIKDKYINSRFDYPYSYPNQYPSGYSSIAKCNDLRKRNFIPPEIKYYQMPQKYIEAHTLLPNSEFRPKISARRSQYHLTDIPAHSMDPYTAQGKVYGFNICDKNNQYTVNPRTIPESSKLRMEYYNHYRGLPYPDTQLLNESMQSQNCNKNNIYAYPMKPPDVNNSYSSLNNVNYQKPGDEQHDRMNEYDAVNNQKFYYNQRYGSGTYNPLAKIPTEFSPNIISPTESSTSFDSLHTVSHQLYQEDGGYVSQCSTTSGKSADYQLMKNSNDKQIYHETIGRVSNMANFITSNNPERECDKSSVKSRNMKSSMDLRQFLEMWDEEFEDSKVVKTHSEANNKSDNGYTNCTQFVSDNPMLPLSEQLYVLDKVNIADGDLHKYEHLQKVTELPGNIKDCDQADNIKKNISKLNRQSITNNPLHHLNIKKDKLNSNTKPMYDLQESMYNIPTNELVDVEAKISQSIIHKDVGCNFEIKPCSPGRPVQMKVEIQHDFNNHSMDANKKKNHLNQIVHANKMQPSEFLHIYESKEKAFKNNCNSNNKPIANVRNSSFVPVNDFSIRKTCYIDTPLPPIESPTALTEHSEDKNFKKSLCANENRETVLHKTNYDVNRKIEQKSEPSKTIISSTLGAYKKESSFIDVSPPNLFNLEKKNELNGDTEFKNTEKTYHKSQKEIDVGMEVCPKGYEGFLEKLKLKTNKVLGNIDEVNQFKADGILAKNKGIIRDYNSTTSPLKCFKNVFEASEPKVDFHLSKELTKIGEYNHNSDIVKIVKTIDSDSKAENYQLGSQKLVIPEELKALNLSPKEEQKFKNLVDAEVVKENNKSLLMSEKLNGTLKLIDLPNIHTDSENTEEMVSMDQILKSTFPIPDKSTKPIIDVYNEETENSVTCLTEMAKAQNVAPTLHNLLGEECTATNTLSLNIQESKLSNKAGTLPKSKSLLSVGSTEIQNCNGELHNIPVLNMCLGDISVNTIKDCDLLSKFNPLLESSYISDKEIIKQSYDEDVPFPKIIVEKDNSISHIKISTINVIECNNIDKSDTSSVSVIKDMKFNQPFVDANIKVNNDYEKKIEIQGAPLMPAQINPEKIEKSSSSISVSKQKNINILNTRNDSDNSLDAKLNHLTSYNVENETKMNDVFLKPHSIHTEVQTSMQMVFGGIKEFIRHESIPTKISNDLDSDLDESTNYDENELNIQEVILKPHFTHIEDREKNVSGKIKKNIRYASKNYNDPDSDMNKLYPVPEESTSYSEDVISKPKLVHIEETKQTAHRKQEKTTFTLNLVDDSDNEFNNLDSNLKKSTSNNINEIKIQDVPLDSHLIHIKEAKETTSGRIQEKIICAYNSIDDSVSHLNTLDSNVDKSTRYIENKAIVHDEILKPHSIHIEDVEETMRDGVQENTMHESNCIDDSNRNLNSIDSNFIKSICHNENEAKEHDEILKPHSIRIEEVGETMCDGVQENTMYVSNSIDGSTSNLNNLDLSILNKSINYNENETKEHDEILKSHSTRIEEVGETMCDVVQENAMCASNSITDSTSNLNNLDSKLNKSISYNENETKEHDEILKSHSTRIEEVGEIMCDVVQENAMCASNSITDSTSNLNNLDSKLNKSISYNENETKEHDEILKSHSIQIEVEETMCDGVQEDVMYASTSINDSTSNLNNLDSNPMKSISCNENETSICDEILNSIHIEEETTCYGVQENAMYTSNSIDDSNSNLNNLDSNLDKSISYNENETKEHDEILKPHSIHIEEIKETMSDSMQENIRNAILNDDSDYSLNNSNSKPEESTSCNENEIQMQDVNLKPHSICIEKTEEIIFDRMQKNVKCTSNVNNSDIKINSLSNPGDSKSEIKTEDIIIKPHLIHIEEVEDVTYDNNIQENVTCTSIFIDDSDCDLNNLDSNPDDLKSYIEEVEEPMSDGIQEKASNPINDFDSDLNNSDSNPESTSDNEKETIFQEVILKSHSIPNEESEETMSDRIQENITYAYNPADDCNLDKLTCSDEYKAQMQDVTVNPRLINIEESMYEIEENTRDALNTMNDSNSDVDNLISNTEKSTSYNIDQRKIHDELIKQDVIHIEKKKRTMFDEKQENIISNSIHDFVGDLNNVDSNSNKSIKYNENKSQMPDIILKSHLNHAEDTENATNILNTIHDSDSDLNNLEYNMKESTGYNKMKMHGVILKSHSIHIEETEDTISDGTMKNIRCASIVHDADIDLDNIDPNPDKPISYNIECETRKQDAILKPKFKHIEETDKTISNISDNILKDVKYVSSLMNDSDTDLDSKRDELTCFNITKVMNITEDVISKKVLYINDAKNHISQKKYDKMESIGLNGILIAEFNNNLNSLDGVPLTSASSTNELTEIISGNSEKYKSFKKKGNGCVKMFDENNELALIRSNHHIERLSSPQYFEETDSSVILSEDIDYREENCTGKSAVPCEDSSVSVDTFNVDESEDIINRTDALLEISILGTQKEICISNFKNIVLDSQLHSIELSVQSDAEELDETVSANENVLLYEIQSSMSPQCDALMENVVSSDIVESLYVTNSRTYDEHVENNTSALNEVLEDTKIDENVVELGGCWIEDIACVETVISEETIFQSEDEIATAASPSEISWGPISSDSEADESVPYSIQHKLDCTEELFKDSNSNIILKNCKLELIKLPDGISQEKDEGHGLRSFAEVQSTKIRPLKLMDVDSTDSTKKRNHVVIPIDDEEKNKISRKKMKLDDAIVKETLVNKCVEKIQEMPSLNTRSNLFSKGKLITKGAQKYIPPPEDRHNHKLKCQLPLPENILLSLSKHNLKNVECNESRHKTNIKVDKHTRSQNNKLPKKSYKPNFEDVLKQIDETNISWSKKKLKRCLNSNKSIPKMIIKKNETGCHYTSIPEKKVHAPDLTGNKWQPWVCLQRNINIEKMVKTKSVRAIFFNYSPQNKKHTLFCQNDNGKCNNSKKTKNCKDRPPKLSPSRALNYIL